MDSGWREAHSSPRWASEPNSEPNRLLAFYCCHSKLLQNQGLNKDFSFYNSVSQKSNTGLIGLKSRHRQGCETSCRLFQLLEEASLARGSFLHFPSQQSCIFLTLLHFGVSLPPARKCYPLLRTHVMALGSPRSPSIISHLKIHTLNRLCKVPSLGRAIYSRGLGAVDRVIFEGPVFWNIIFGTEFKSHRSIERNEPCEGFMELEAG